MQLQDKLVEDSDAAHAESQQREDLQEHGDAQLPEPVREAVHEASRERRGQLLGAVRMILDRQRLDITSLHLPARESRALTALEVAASGRSSDLGQFVYASDRRDLLERALGVLQPDLAQTDDQTARELAAQLSDVSERVAELRHALASLEDAQDELFERDKAAFAVAPADPATEPDPAAAAGDAAVLPAETTLTGPELPEAARPETTLTGPELPEAARPGTTLTGPEPPEAARPGTTLTGPELPEAPPAPSSLGDPDDLRAAAASTGSPAGGDGGSPDRPAWWRRPFG